MGFEIWSITMDFVPKSKITPMLAKVSTPRMGLILKYLDFEYGGNCISKVPTSVVFKVPFEVFNLTGVLLSLP